MGKSAFYFIFILMFISKISSAQIVCDTIGPIITNTLYGPIININYYRTFTVFSESELALKGIVPGSLIYGIGYHKTNTASINPNSTASVTFKYRIGGNVNSLSNYLAFPSFFGNTYTTPFVLLPGFTNAQQYNSWSNLIIPPNPSWVPFMLDQPFIYTGGAFEVFSDWSSSATPLTNVVYWSSSTTTALGGNLSMLIGSSSSQPPIGFNGGLGSTRPTTIIYHSINPPACNGIPNGGTVLGSDYVCANDSFTLYLSNPSAGPGIGYQWQMSNLSPVSWSNISGATNSSLKTATSTSKLYRCNVTCANSNQTTASTVFTQNLKLLQIDSVTTVYNGNEVTLTAHVDTNTVEYYNWIYGNSNYVVNLVFQHQYTVDSTYFVTFQCYNLCSSTSVTVPVTIGCPGGTTFDNTISIDKTTTCPNGAVQLQVLDTVPSNYTVSWVQYTQTGYAPIPGITGSSITQYPSITTGYYSKATCNISGNSKQSNLVTVNVSAPPIAGSITATNTTGNLYQFANNGMYNAQSYVWYFGDGDTSTQLSPIHHYNWAGNYTAMLVATNAGNGCSDTATTQVSITTSVEALPHESSFSLTPNPFKESLQLTTQQPMGSITIYDAQGKKIKQQTIKTTTTNMDLKGIPSGVYLVEYDNGNKKESRKLVKE